MARVAAARSFRAVFAQLARGAVAPVVVHQVMTTRAVLARARRSVCSICDITFVHVVLTEWAAEARACATAREAARVRSKSRRALARAAVHARISRCTRVSGRRHAPRHALGIDRGHFACAQRAVPYVHGCNVAVQILTVPPTTEIVRSTRGWRFRRAVQSVISHKRPVFIQLKPAVSSISSSRD